MYGGSRSGKTFLAIRTIVTRALASPKSRHAILRYRFNHLVASIVNDTFPKVMSLCFPEVKWRLDRSWWYVTLPNGSEIWFGGLDEKERVEKVLGNEYATILLNEVSQMPYASRNVAMTRLAMRCTYTDTAGLERVLRLKMLYDENPPSKAHWSYLLFVKKVDPDSKRALDKPEDYASFSMNPEDNRANLAPEYLDTLAGLPARMKRRFLEGQFGEAAAGALWTLESIDACRHDTRAELPEMLRIVVAVDPSGAGDEDNAGNDEIGIVVCGLGIDGNGWVIEDLTCKAGPGVWGKVATQAYDRHAANMIVAEKNYGGEMVRHVIQAARANTPCRLVTASRGKSVRAEPVAALTDNRKIRFAGYFPEMEDELCAMTDHGYVGSNSPNRADAMIWGMTDLFPQISAEPRKKRKESTEDDDRPAMRGGWMR